MSSPTPIVQLAALSSRTIRCGMIMPNAIPQAALEAGHDAVALADRGVTAALPALAQAAVRAKIPCVLGVWVDLETLAPCQRAGPPQGAPADVMVWAKTPEGVASVIRISSQAMRTGANMRVATEHLVETEPNDVGILSANAQSTQKLEGRTEYIGVLRARPPIDDGKARIEDERTLRNLADAQAIPCAALAPWITHTEQAREAAAVLGATARTPTSTLEARLPRLNASIALRSRATLIEDYADAPELLENAGHLAASARALPRPMQGTMTRKGETLASDARALTDAARRGLESKLERIAQPLHPRYEARLAHELTVIAENGFAGLYLTTQALVQWTRENGRLAGPGRGSSASSIVAWALEITAHDPIAHDLLFERFLAPGRSIAPDFDLDFEPAVQARAQQYLAELWGSERSATVSTWLTLSPADDGIARAAITLSLRARGTPEPGIRRAIESIETQTTRSLSPSDQARVTKAIDDARHMAQACSARGRHPAAIALLPEPIEGRLATVEDEHATLPALQIDHDEAEAAGAAKIDCLALETLTMLREARANARLDDDPWDDTVKPCDARAYARIASGQTLGIFQMEAPGATKMAEDVGLDSFDDLRLLVALNRPGTRDHAEPTAARRRGEAPVEVAHPALAPLLEDTYGLIVYQEQSLRVAQTIAGFTPEQADRLRRAISKKKADEMATLAPLFAEGVRRTHPGTPRAVIEELWETLSSQAQYAFNRAHSTCYAAIARACARIREASPGAYACALTQSTVTGRRRHDAMHRKLARIAASAACTGIVFIPPSPWHPTATCRLRSDQRTIDVGASLIDGVGEELARRWGATPPCTAPHGDLDAATQWMRNVGLSQTSIEAAIELMQHGERWSLGAQGRLPPAHEQTTLAARGSLNALKHLRADDAQALPTGSITRVLARLTPAKSGAMLEDSETRLYAFTQHGTKAPETPIAVVATLRAESPPILLGWVALDTARKEWPASITLSGQRSEAADTIVAAVLDAFTPGPDRITGDAAPDDATRRRINASPQCLQALRTALADANPPITVERHAEPTRAPR